MTTASNTGTYEGTRLHGLSLWMARILWVGILLLALGLVARGAEPYIRHIVQIDDICEVGQDCTLTAIDAAALSDIGLTPSFFAWFLLIFGLVDLVGSLIATGVIATPPFQ